MWIPLEPWQVAQLQRLSESDPSQIESSLNALWAISAQLLEQITISALEQGTITSERATQVLGYGLEEVERALAKLRRNNLKRSCLVVCGNSEAKLADSGIPVWEIIRVYRRLGSISKLQQAFKNLSLQTLGSALIYAEQNAEDISRQIASYELAVEQRASGRINGWGRLIYEPEMKFLPKGPVLQNLGTPQTSVAVTLLNCIGRFEMRITDYESTKNLTDVGLVLTRDEAEELCIYLHKMLARADVRQAYLTELRGCGIERELSVSIEPGARPIHLSAWSDAAAG